MFNLNMKHDVFKVKNLEKLSNKELQRHVTESSMATEKVTVKNIALIRKHYRRFNISNIGNFQTRVVDVTLSNHQKKHNRFTLTKLAGNQGYEIMYEPDFRHSNIDETILVKTENSVTEFKIQANIPLYLIKFIDSNFRLSEIEEHIGNWYYLIVLSFVLLTLLLLGTELVEYVIFLKQKNINYTLLTELISAYEKTKELAQEEQKMEKLSNILRNNSDQLPSQLQSDQKTKKPTPKKLGSNTKAKSVPSDESKAKIEEIKKKLADRIDFDEGKNEKYKHAMNASPEAKGYKHYTERQPVAKHSKNKKKFKGSFVDSSNKSDQKKEIVNLKSRDVKTPKKGRVKENKPQNSTFDKKIKQKDITSESDNTVTSNFIEVPSKRRDEKISERNKNSFIKSQNKQKEKEKQRVQKEEKKKMLRSNIAESTQKPVKPDIQKPNPKTSEFKRGKQRNQPKQNKAKDVVVDLTREQEVIADNRVVFPPSMYQSVPQVNMNNDAEFPSLEFGSNKEENSPTERVPTKEPSKKESEKEKAKKLVDSSQTEKNQKSENPKEAEPMKSNVVGKKPRQVETATIKLYSRQQTEESAVSEPNKEPRNRLSNAQSNNSWADNDEGGESYNPRSEYTDEDRLDDSEDKNIEEESMDKSYQSQSGSSNKESQKSAKKDEEKKFDKNPNVEDNKKATSGRQNPYYRNDYNDLKYYKKSQYDPTAYKGSKKVMKKGYENLQRAGNSYQDYKRELREQKNKHSYGTKGYYQNSQQDYYTKPGKPKEEVADVKNVTRGKYREDKAPKPQYYYDPKEDYSYDKYGQGNYPKHINPEPKIDEDEEEDSKEDKQEEPSSFQDSHEDLQNYVEENKDLIQIPSENDEKESDPPSGYFEEKDTYPPSEFNMFSAFQNPSRDFSLFSPVQDGIFGEDDKINFSSFNDSSDPVNQEEDEVLGRFTSLQDLRDQSEIINYDITRKSFKYRSGYSSKSPE